MQFKNLVAIVLGFVTIYNLLFFQIQPGLGVGLWYLFLNLYFYLIREKKSQNLDYAILSSGIAVLAGVLVSFRANEVVLLINHLLALLFSTTSLFFYKSQTRFKLTIPGFLLIPPTSFIESFKSVINLLFGEKEKNTTSAEDLIPSIIKGTLIAVVVFGVLLLLLRNADVVFATLIDKFLENIWQRLLFSTVLFVSLITLGITKFKSQLLDLEKAVESSLGKAKTIELTIILSSVILLFTTFILVQFRYLFFSVGELELKQIGIDSATYSEYVRNGFFELLIASSIAIGLVIYSLRYLHRLVEKQNLLIKILTSVLTIETFIILVSDLKRLSLYAEAHGLTRAREFGFIFLVWLGVMLIFFIFRIFSITKESLHTKLVLGTTILILLSVNIFNLDKLIAQKYPPTVNKEIDYLYLVNLSTDGSDSWVEAVNSSENLFTEYLTKDSLATDENRKFILTKYTLENLKNKTEYLEDKYSPYSTVAGKYPDEIPDRVLVARKWQSINISEYLSYQLLKDNHEIFNKIPKLLEQAKTIDSKVTDAVRNETQLDRSTQAPLVND